MGRGTIKRVVGLSDHAVESNKWNALCFGFEFEAIILLEVSFPTLQIEAYDNSHIVEVLARDLDLANERRENAQIPEAISQALQPKSSTQTILIWRLHFEKRY